MHMVPSTRALLKYAYLFFGFDLAVVLWEVLSRLYKYTYRKSRNVNSRALGLRTLVDGMVDTDGFEPTTDSL